MNRMMKKVANDSQLSAVTGDCPPCLLKLILVIPNYQTLLKLCLREINIFIFPIYYNILLNKYFYISYLSQYNKLYFFYNCHFFLPNEVSLSLGGVRKPERCRPFLPLIPFLFSYPHRPSPPSPSRRALPLLSIPAAPPSSSMHTLEAVYGWSVGDEVWSSKRIRKPAPTSAVWGMLYVLGFASSHCPVARTLNSSTISSASLMKIVTKWLPVHILCPV